MQGQEKNTFLKQVAIAAGFRHSWAFDLPQSIRNSILRNEEGVRIYHRKRWLNISALPEVIEQSDFKGRNVILTGAGTGGIIKNLFSAGALEITVLEKNPVLFLQTLSDDEIFQKAAEGRITYADPIDVMTGAVSIPADAALVSHPVLGHVYRDVVSWLESGRRIAPFDVLMEGELLIDDWLDTLQEKGLSAYIYPHFWLDPAIISKQLAHPLVQRIWSINRIQGLDKLAEVLRKPYLIYEIDPDLSEIPASPGKNTSIFTFRISQAEAYRNAGWPAEYLPLAAAPRMKRIESTTHRCDVSFVGTSILQNAAVLINLLRTTFARPEIEQIINQFIAHQVAAPMEFLADKTFQMLLETGVPPSFPSIGGPVSTRKILHEWSGAIHRIHLVTKLAPFKAHVWGDEGWAGIAERSEGLIYRGPAGNRFEVPKIYSSSRINVDITRLYQPDVATIRLFDVFACGSIAVTNVSGPATDLFSSPGLLQFSDGNSLDSLLDNVLSWAEKKQAEYARAMQEQTRNAHMLGNRLEKMLQSSGF